MKLLRLTLLGLALALPAAGFAQWQWIDQDGRKVFSDQPPPVEVPAKSILRQPGSKSLAASVSVEAQAAAASASAPQSAKVPPGVPKISGKDKELEEKKKRLPRHGPTVVTGPSTPRLLSTRASASPG
jgi:hypothetical protein